MIILSPTYHRNEHYCDIVIDLLDCFWQDHPEAWFLTDSGEKIEYEKVIKHDEDNWVLLLKYGVEFIKSNFKDNNYVFLLLEDLYPLRPCDVNELRIIENVVVQNRLLNVAFNTYNHHWKQGDERYFNDKKLYLIPKGIIPSSQLQPAIWHIDHLLDTIDFAINSKIFNPWDFESIRISDKHYVADYLWPNVLDGFFVRNKINIGAALKIQMPEGRKLRNKLLFEFLYRNEFVRKIKRVPYKITSIFKNYICFLE